MDIDFSQALTKVKRKVIIMTITILNKNFQQLINDVVSTLFFRVFEGKFLNFMITGYCEVLAQYIGFSAMEEQRTVDARYVRVINRDFKSLVNIRPKSSLNPTNYRIFLSPNIIFVDIPIHVPLFLSLSGTLCNHTSFLMIHQQRWMPEDQEVVTVGSNNLYIYLNKLTIF